MPSLRTGERGSVLLLEVFLIVAVVSAITVVADVGAVISARQRLAATADQAAIAGAQAVDLDAYYRSGAGAAPVDLEPAAVAGAVRRYLAPAIAAGQQESLALESVSVRGGTVTVRLSSRADLPFTGSLGAGSVPVSASASAQLQIRPRQ